MNVLNVEIVKQNKKHGPATEHGARSNAGTHQRGPANLQADGSLAPHRSAPAPRAYFALSLTPLVLGLSLEPRGARRGLRRRLRLARRYCACAAVRPAPSPDTSGSSAMSTSLCMSSQKRAPQREAIFFEDPNLLNVEI